MTLKRVPVEVEANFAGWRLDLYLRQKIRRLSREQIQGLIATRLEHSGPGRLKPATRVVAGMRFVLLSDLGPEPPTPMSFGVVFDDAELLILSGHKIITLPGSRFNQRIDSEEMVRLAPDLIQCLPKPKPKTPLNPFDEAQW